jgi:ABC-type uncharacterized transport system involved in gliding motility auxiliary subunit
MLNRILGLVGWLGFAAVVGALAIRYGAVSAKDQYATYLAYTGLVCLLAYILGQWRDIAKLFTRRQARYGTLTVVSVLVVLGILVAINYIGARQNKRWDLTANKQFSLSDQTRGVLQKLDSPLQITAFDKDENFGRFRDRLKEYEYVTKKVVVEYVDPDKKPQIAAQNQIQAYGTLLFAYKGRTQRITTDTEQDVTAAIIKVVQGEQKKIYFTQGHSERDTASAQRDGYKAIGDALGHENYTVDKLILAQTPSVPDDAAVVVVAGPRTDFQPEEIEALKKYLAKNGKLLLELDPPAKADGPAQAGLIALAHDWGIDVNNDIILDGASSNPTVAIVASYPAHAITQQLRDFTGYPLARSLTVVQGGVNGHIAQGIAETGPQSLAKADVKGILTTGKASPQIAAGDRRGPVTIAAAVSAAGQQPEKTDANAAKAETRVVVFGDSDFAANYAVGLPGNQDLFMNTIGWLTQQENLISIRPKEADDRRIALTPVQVNEVTLMSLLLIPGLVFATGVYSWWRRR